MSRTVEYWAVIGDLVASRRAANRAAVQRRYIAALAAVNARFAADVAAPFRVLRGDECEGLLLASADSYAVLRFVQRALTPQGIRFGVGFGPLQTPPTRGCDVAELDGPAFHRARTALGWVSRLYRPDCPLLAQYELGDGRTELINAVLLLLGQRFGGLTARQRQIYEQYQVSGSMAAAAAALRLSKSTVSDALSAAKHAPLAAAERALALGLQGRRYVDSAAGLVAAARRAAERIDRGSYGKKAVQSHSYGKNAVRPDSHARKTVRPAPRRRARAATRRPPP